MTSNPMTGIVDRYRHLTPGSAAVDVRARSVMPGGDTRAVAFHQPYPLTIARTAGVHLWDVDGNRYIDLLGNYTSLVHGNAFPPIVAAAAEASAAGSQWAARSMAAVELAETLCSRVPSVEQVRFTNSGSEATLLAVEIAREVTGRRRILMARYGYHGSGAIFETGTHGRPGPETLLADYGDSAGYEAVLDDHGDDIACVIIEPVLGAGGVIEPPEGHLAAVAAAARRHGALFVLDEVITLRLAPGGVQEVLGLGPDLTTMGKIIGGGYAVGAVGGRSDLMAVTDPERGRIAASGTFNANPVATAAGAVSLAHLTAERMGTMADQAQRLAAGIHDVAADAGFDARVTRVGSLLNLYVDADPAPGPLRADTELIAATHLALLGRGVFIAPRGMMALSTVLTDADIDEAVERFGAAFADLAAERG